MKNKLIYFILILFYFSFASAFLVSDQGTDVVDLSTGNLTSIANLTISIYDDPSAGNLIFQQTFEGGIINGSWNVMINPNLEYGKSYWKDYEINGEDLDFDGNERLEFQSSVGMINNFTFVNFSLINSCPAGSSIRIIYENGSVLCEVDDSGSGSSDLTNYALKNQSENFQGNITTSQTGFFGWLGNLFSRINKLFVQDIEFNGTINGSGEIITSGNVTADYFIGDGSYLTGVSGDSYDDSWINDSVDNRIFINNQSVNDYILWVNSTNSPGEPLTETDPLWTANYTLFNNSWSNTFNATTNQTLTNAINSIASIGEPNWNSNFTAFNSSWSSTTNISYATWNAINNGSYLNEPYTDTFIGNYSTFLTHMPYSAWNATNTSYATWLALNNGTYANVPESDPLWTANYTLFNNSWSNTFNATTNQTLTNAINSIASIGEPNWNSNFTAFNSSWSSTTNISYATWNAINNGSYLNEPYTDTFIGNYSTFLTHMPYSAWNATNTSYATWLALNNGTYANVPESDPLWTANYTLFNNSWSNTFNATTNQTLTNAINSIASIGEPNWNSNFTAFNSSWSSTTNISYATWNAINNGSYLNEPYTDTFIGNYSTFLTHMPYSAWNATNTSYATWLALNNGTYANVPESDPLWTANYTLFNNSWSNTFNATTNQTLTNAINSIASIGEPNWNSNFTAFNSSWSSTTNISYATWNAINNGSYLNEPYTDTFIGNYSTFLTHMPYSAWNATNTSYATWLALNNGTYANVPESDPLWTANYTLFNNSWSNTFNATTNQTLTNAINSIASIGEPNWNSNFTAFNSSWSSTTNISYATWNAINNGSYLNEPYTDTFIGNYSTFLTHMPYSAWNATNTSYATWLALNNGTYANVPETDPLWTANYTLFNNSWSNTFNATTNQTLTNAINSIASIGEPNWNSNFTAFNSSWSSTTNISYATWNAINNGSYLNEPYTDTFIGNYSTFLTHMPYSAWNATNTSYATWLALNNGTYANVPETDSLAYNGTLVSVGILNNGSYLNEPYTDSFIGNYSTFLTHMPYSAWNATNTSYYLASNPFGFYNSSSGIGNWSADKSSYVLLSILNNGSYLNEPYTDTFIGNYSTFLTHITWANVMNGTLAKYSELNNGTYANVPETDPHWTANYSAFNSSWSSTYNSTYNTWAYNQTIPANTYTDSRVSASNLHTHDASNITSPIWVNKTGDTMSGDLNMDSNNITAVDCITFASGGKICSG